MSLTPYISLGSWGAEISFANGPSRETSDEINFSPHNHVRKQGEIFKKNSQLLRVAN